MYVKLHYGAVLERLSLLPLAFARLPKNWIEISSLELNLAHRVNNKGSVL